jgi:hypothetical protein
MKLTLKKHPHQAYSFCSPATALRYGWWRPSGEIFKNLKHEYNFDDFLSGGDIALQIYELEANKKDYKNDLLKVFEENNIPYHIKTMGPNKFIVVKKGDFIKQKTKRN